MKVRAFESFVADQIRSPSASSGRQSHVRLDHACIRNLSEAVHIACNSDLWNCADFMSGLQAKNRLDLRAIVLPLRKSFATERVNHRAPIVIRVQRIDVAVDLQRNVPAVMDTVDAALIVEPRESSTRAIHQCIAAIAPDDSYRNAGCASGHRRTVIPAVEINSDFLRVRGIVMPLKPVSVTT